MKPIVELHLHLDGSLRIPTMLEIARAEGIRLPACDEDGLREALRCGEIRHSLPTYLEHFAHTTSVMQSRAALTRIAAELIEDCAAEGLKYVETRFMPSLHTKGGLREEEVMEAVIDGLTLGSVRTGIGWGLIVCSMRHVSPEETGRMIDLAIRFRRYGAVAVDLAGNDMLPALDHAPHFLRAKDAGLHVTIHAAESGPPERIREAVTAFGADRIGHAVNAIKDRRMLDLLARDRIGVEACLTSNLQVGTVGMIETHPARSYLKEGLLVALNTDNRMLADTTMEREHALARDLWKLEDADLERLVLNGIEMAFLGEDAKLRLMAAAQAASATP